MDRRECIASNQRIYRITNQEGSICFCKVFSWIQRSNHVYIVTSRDGRLMRDDALSPARSEHWPKTCHRCAHAGSPCRMWVNFLLPYMNARTESIMYGVRKRHENLANSIAVERHKIVRSSCATELTWETISIKQLAGAFSILLMMAEASPAIVWRFCFTDEYAMFALGVWPQLASYWNSQHANENSSHTFFISTQLTFLWIK